MSELANMPLISVPSGNYEKTCIIEITAKSNGKILYSTDGTNPEKPYRGPFAIRNSAVVKAVEITNSGQSEIAISEININKNNLKKGSVVIIGGAEHCTEIHKKLVDLAGGVNSARIAFLPTSSRDPYSAGMDRRTRFAELAGLQINENEVPLTGGKKDYSHLNNNSRFWIMPVAVMDDENSGKNVKDDEKAPLCHESTFPDIDESTWIGNARNVEVATKLRDGGYNLVFMTGGNQARYLECLYYDDYTETPLLTIIREILEEKGGVVAGTSAGAAVLSEVMIQGGGSYGATMAGVIHQDIDLAQYNDEYTPFKDIYDGRVWVGRGFGFLPPHIISGTHFVARGRVGRLLTAALYLKGLRNFSVTGIGVDEDTAVCVYPDNTCEVVGALGALVIETSVSSPIPAGRGCIDCNNNFILHYLEHGDVFSIDPATGRCNVVKINPSKKLVDSPGDKPYYMEPDIFGGNAIKEFINNCLIHSKTDSCIGTEIIDNTENSYDSILYHDLVKDDTVLFHFTKGPETKGYAGSISYSWWGRGDVEYPNLLHETEENRFSFCNVNAEIMALDLLNFPDLSDAESIPLKSQYIKDGYTRQEWQDMFDRNKNYRLGLILLPHTNGSISLHSFFLDYAYCDYDDNGHYSPPRLIVKDKEGDFKDYDIVQMNIAPESEVFINGQSVGSTNEAGYFKISPDTNWNEIKLVFHGQRTDYEVTLNHKDFNKKGVLVFEEIR